MTKNKTRQRILDRVAATYPCTTVGLLASDLLLSPGTVRRHVAALLESGLLEEGLHDPAIDGAVPYQLTGEARRDRAETEAVRAVAAKAVRS